MDRSLLAPAFLALAPGLGCSSISGIRVDQRAERVETVALELSSGSTLTLDTRHGDITVEAADGAEASLRATIHASGRTVEEAQAVLARYSLEVTRGPDGPIVRLVGEPLRTREPSLNMQLSASADLRPGLSLNCGEAIRKLAPLPADLDARPLSEIVASIQRDIREFKERRGLDDVKLTYGKPASSAAYA